MSADAADIGSEVRPGLPGAAVGRRGDYDFAGAGRGHTVPYAEELTGGGTEQSRAFLLNDDYIGDLLDDPLERGRTAALGGSLLVLAGPIGQKSMATARMAAMRTA